MQPRRGGTKGSPGTRWNGTDQPGRCTEGALDQALLEDQVSTLWIVGRGFRPWAHMQIRVHDRGDPPGSAMGRNGDAGTVLTGKRSGMGRYRRRGATGGEGRRSGSFGGGESRTGTGTEAGPGPGPRPMPRAGSSLGSGPSPGLGVG